MAFKVVRKGDVNTAGGVALSGTKKVRVNGRPVVFPGVSVSPHPCCGVKASCIKHCRAKTAGGSSKVFVEGKPVIRVKADKDTCGHPRATGSHNVVVA